LKTYPLIRLANIAFLIALLVNLLCNQLGWQLPQAFSKALLMPLLMIQLYLAKKKSQEKAWRLVFAGLLAAWAGDLLLLNGAEPSFFIAGLVSFLTTHILYIFYFLRYKPTLDQTWFWKHPIVSFLVAGYGIAYYAFLLEKLGSMIIPVAVYCLVITIMLLQSLACQHIVPKPVYRLFVGGAALFVLSDSILAFNKFYSPLPWAGVAIMATYGIAQLLITKGAIANGDRKEKDSAAD
jgi:uncharacterized membrane protein YhhN